MRPRSKLLHRFLSNWASGHHTCNPTRQLPFVLCRLTWYGNQTILNQSKPNQAAATIDPRGDGNEGEDNDDADDERCKLQMQSAGWQRLLHTQPCPSSHAEGTGPAHYLKMLMIRMIISKMATKINSMMATKANMPIMNMVTLMIQDQIDGFVMLF